MHSCASHFMVSTKITFSQRDGSELMQQPTMAPYPVSDFLQWEGMKQLVLTPKFQRRDVWTAKAKSYLIDTIVRRMPISPIFLRLRIDSAEKRIVREVVDGQQRLRAVLGYLRGEFSILKAHNEEFAGHLFDDLSDEVRGEFLSYKFQVNVLEGISDADVLRLFARLNTYTQPLKGQELINAEFFGVFKQTVYDLGFKFYSFWTTNNILTDALIARMADAELCSELAIAMLDGIRQTKSKDIREYYKRYDDEFASANKIKGRFTEVIDETGNLFDGSLKTSPFRRQPLFFSLFLAIYDMKYHLPGSVFRPAPLPDRRTFLDRVNAVRETLASKDAVGDAARFVDASSRATADVGRRQARHDYLMQNLFGQNAGEAYAFRAV